MTLFIFHDRISYINATKEVFMNKQLLKEELRRKHMTLRDFAQYLGINAATLYRKMNKTSDFTLPEIQKVRVLLGTNTTVLIFFAEQVAQTQQ